MNLASWMKLMRILSRQEGKTLSQGELSRRMKIDVGTLSRWERGDTVPSDALMTLWAIEVGVDVNEAMTALSREREGRPVTDGTDQKPALKSASPSNGRPQSPNKPDVQSILKMAALLEPAERDEVVTRLGGKPMKQAAKRRGSDRVDD